MNAFWTITLSYLLCDISLVVLSKTNFEDPKKILYLSTMKGFLPKPVESDWRPVSNKCHYRNCVVTQDTSKQEEADVVLFRRDIDFPGVDVTRAHANQVWIYCVNESPYTVEVWKQIEQSGVVFNWTATYRMDSTIFMPISETLRRRKPRSRLPNMAAQRQKKVAWLVSHCHVHNKRMEYARELQKYIDVDIYGGCGDISCEGGKGNHSCKTETLKLYKFYLAFENTNCKDYITEKLWNNALKNGILPIVMGASKASYTKVAPPNSFIHVDDFVSPYHLADYLKVLDADDGLYNQYFNWMLDYELAPRPNVLCRVCELLHTMRGIITYYNDIGIWYNNTDTCVLPSEDNPYASWKIAGYTD